MANYCPNCGWQVSSGDAYCAQCGAALGGTGVSGTTASGGSAAKTVATAAGAALGTLVLVNLIGGATRRLYYRGGRYFLDPYCRNPFMQPHMIMGRRPMHGGMGGPHGGFHGGPEGGPRGGGHR